MQMQLDEQIQHFRPILLSIAEAIISPALRGHLEASDLVQQTLLEAHCDAAKLADADGAKLFVWLQKSLKHNLIDAVKHLQTKKRDMGRQVRISEVEESFDRLEQLWIADQTSPSQIVERKEQVLLMLARLQELPPDQRTAVIMKHLQGCSQREIAQALNRSEAAVGGLLDRGRKNLIDAMEAGGHS
jgi:RNA polymerase sigma-70 factor (ECF subfamily)